MGQLSHAVYHEEVVLQCCNFQGLMTSSCGLSRRKSFVKDSLDQKLRTETFLHQIIKTCRSSNFHVKFFQVEISSILSTFEQTSVYYPLIVLEIIHSVPYESNDYKYEEFILRQCGLLLNRY